MFTGILKGIAEVIEVKEAPRLTSFALAMISDDDLYLEGVQIGASVAVDGVCLTVTKTDGRVVWFDVMEETLQKTTIGTVQKGGRFNVERSFCARDEIGGHIVSGHVTGMAEIVQAETPENNHILTFKIPKQEMKYVFKKGFIALNGASLTIVDVDKREGTFTVHFIPETLELTTFSKKIVQDLVNFEIDSRTQAIVDTTEAYLQERN